MSRPKNLPQNCGRLAILLSVLAASTPAARAQVVFTPPKNISNSSGNTQAQQVAVDSSGNITLVWADNSPGNYAIFVSHSSDGGATFSTPASISKHAQGTASDLRIAVNSSGNVSVVWTEATPDGSANFIYFSHSTNGGITFSNPQNISGDAGAATNPRMAVDSRGNVNIVWVDTSLGNSEIFFSRSADGGTTFSTPLNISNDADDSVSPTIAVDSNDKINVAWADHTLGPQYNIFFGRSKDGGASFSPPLQLTKSDQNVFAKPFTQVASLSNGNIGLLWIERNPIEVFPVFARSTDGGATFSPPIGATLSRSFQFATSATMALDPNGSDIGIIEEFTDADEPGSPFVHFGYSADAGASLTAGGSLGAQTTGNPQVVLDVIGRFDATYAQTSYFGAGVSCLCFTQSADGNQFSRPLTITSFIPITPAAMAVDPAGNVFVAWLQSASSGGPANVFFSRGTVPPFSFSISPTRITEGGASTGTVKLVSPARAGGAVISLSNSNPSVVSEPASVTVAGGASNATFTVSAGAVQSSTAVTISATFNGSSNTASLFVDPLFQLFVFGNTTGGNTATGEVALTQPAPSGGLVISLSSSDPSVANPPSSVTVPAASRFASFSFRTSLVSTPTTVQITGTSNGFSHSASFTVQP